jgi:hypothetical protein
MGLDDAVDYWKSHGDSFDMVLITDEGELYATDGISSQLTTEKEIHVLTR